MPPIAYKANASSLAWPMRPLSISQLHLKSWQPLPPTICLNLSKRIVVSWSATPVQAFLPLLLLLPLTIMDFPHYFTWQKTILLWQHSLNISEARLIICPAFFPSGNTPTPSVAWWECHPWLVTYSPAHPCHQDLHETQVSPIVLPYFIAIVTSPRGG